MADFDQQFLLFAIETLQRVANESGAAIREAAECVADAVQQGNLLMLFGSGHSALVAQDGAGRAGGLIQAMIVEDAINGDAEQLEGMAKIIASRYAFEAGSVLIVISNSGINPVPLEMATMAQQRGLKVIAITSLSHSKSVNSRHSSGKKLYEVADIVIDTCGVRGDAVLEVPGTSVRTGATSTMIGCAIVQAITAQAVAILAERGETPPVLISANIPESREFSHELLKKYRTRLARYQLPLRWD